MRQTRHLIQPPGASAQPHRRSRLPLLAAAWLAMAATGCAASMEISRQSSANTPVLAPGPGTATAPIAAPSAGFALVRDAYRAVDKIERMRIVLRGRGRNIDPVADAPTTRCYQRLLAGTDVLHAEAREQAEATEAALRTGDRLAAEQAWQTVRVHEQTVALWTETGCAAGITTR